MVDTKIPDAPRSITRGSTLKDLLDREAIDCLVLNVGRVYRRFDGASFRRAALRGLKPLGILQRGQHLASALREHLPERYESAAEVLIRSLGPPLDGTDEFGLAPFFYLPHVCFVGAYGVDAKHNGGDDPFETSMKAQHELTRRFSAEFSMRAFLLHDPKRTLARLMKWTRDPSPHVRRLCSEGARPRLPWAVRIPAFIADPRPVLPILEALKDDPELYVRRSVANHVGDIAKNHPKLAFEICERWLESASTERRWVIRHALRHPAKKGVAAAARLRKRAA
ncbi:MAG: DNA alkylation repair protein [Verrucomicrobia bacterium]|nr:DNA alkylation repair protein [Verrucomicrobiota bacterium]